MGTSSILVTCLIGLFTGISVGAGVVTAQLWGARKEDRVLLCMENGLLLGTAGVIILTVLGLLLSRQALIWLNTPKEIMEHALIYIRIYLLSILGMILYNMSAGILRAVGDSKTPFYVLAAGGCLNICMDALFIAVLRWGGGRSPCYHGFPEFYSSGTGGQAAQAVWTVESALADKRGDPMQDIESRISAGHPV